MYKEHFMDTLGTAPPASVDVSFADGTNAQAKKDFLS